jgi:hypothetical protein
MTINWNKPIEYVVGDKTYPATLLTDRWRSYGDSPRWVIMVDFPEGSSIKFVGEDGKCKLSKCYFRNKPVIVERWQNIYKYRVGDTYAGGGTLHPSEEDARTAGEGGVSYLTTIKVTFEDTGA